MPGGYSWLPLLLLSSQSSLSWHIWGSVESREPDEDMKPELCSVGSVKQTDSCQVLMPRMSSNCGRVGWPLTLSSAWNKSLEVDVVGEGVEVITLSRGITANPRQALSLAPSGLPPSSLSGSAALLKSCP